jgi:2'-5' RNA ligase
MRSYPVPDWLQTDIGAASLRIESVEQVAVTASGNAAEWADRIVSSEYAQLCKTLTACGCDTESKRYYGILDPEYPEPLVIAVVSLDSEDRMHRWSGSGWDEVPPEYEPEGYPYISLDGGILADALTATAGLLLRPTSPKGRIRSGALVSAAETATPGKTFAIVDEFDTNAVLELFEVRPGPKAYVRRDGEWAADTAILGRLQSVDPPRVVQLEPEQVDAIAKSVDEYDRAHADKAITAARMMDDRYTTPTRKVAPRTSKPKPKPKGDTWPTGTGIEAIGHLAKDIGKVGRRTGRAARRRQSRGSGKFDESKFNRVDGKFAPKGASDNHANDRKPGRGSSSRKRIRVSQATVDELNRHSMAENIAKANSGKASPEFVEAARRFYPGKIKPQPGSGSSGSSRGSSGRGRGSSGRKARAKAKRKGAKLTPADKKAIELEAKEKAERVAIAKWEVRRKKSDLAESKRRGDFNDVVKKFYENFDPEKTTDDAMRRINALVAAEQRRRDNYDRAAAYESEAEQIRRLERRIKLGLIASVGDRALVASPPERSMMPGNLKGFWVRGKGAAKIRWGTGGDFNRCRRALAKYLRPDQIGGACANLHKAATGTWPGKGRSHTASAVLAAAYEGNGSMVSFRIDPELAEKLAENLEDGNPADEMHVTLAYLGEDVDPETLNAAVSIADAIALEYNTFPAYLGGRGQFLNDEVANYASVDSPNLEGFWADLVDRLGRAGVWFAADHGFTPHVTLKYGEMGEHEWPELPVRTSLGTIEVRSGGNVLSSRELLP